MLSEQAIAARREYKKMWARKNPEKVRAQQERYWQKRAEQLTQEAQQEPNNQQAQEAQLEDSAPQAEGE